MSIAIGSWINKVGALIVIATVMGYLIIPQVSQAQEVANTTITQTATGNAGISTVDLANSTATQWGVSETDWTRYQTLMTGEAGLHYRHLEPAFVLGIYSDTEADREKYAEIYYRQEKARLARLFAFNRAYMRHATEIDGDKRLINTVQVAERKAQLEIAPKPLSAGVSLSATNDRHVVFVKRNCSLCDTAVKRLVDARRRFEIYYSGADKADEIRNWASVLNIPPERVKSGDISLNFDQGFSTQLGITEFPAVYRTTKLEEQISVDDAVKGAQ